MYALLGNLLVIVTIKSVILIVLLDNSKKSYHIGSELTYIKLVQKCINYKNTLFVHYTVKFVLDLN